MKKSIKLLILSLIISSIAYANTLSLDEALNIYYKKSTTVKNLKLDSEIRKETTKELENELNKNLKVTADTAYNTDEDDVTTEAKVSYKDAYISASTSTSDSSDKEILIGVEKTLNEFLYNTDKASILSNKISNLNEELTAKQSLMSSISDLGDKYVELLNQKNTIKSTNTLIAEKQKELEIAKIKLSSNNMSTYDVKVIELSINELKTTLQIAQVEKGEMLQEFKDLLGVEEEISVENIENVDIYEIYKDNSSVQIVENQIALAKDQLKGLKVGNLPELTAGASYDLENEDTTVSLGVEWSPLNYKGDEKSKELNIEKLNNQLVEAKKSFDLTNKKSQNEIVKLELNLDLSKQTFDLAKLELEKYKIMKDKGTLSEYDYFDKQKDVLDDEITYLNNLNSLNLAKKLQIIYSNM